MDTLRNAILFIGLFGILGLFYFKVHFYVVNTIIPRFRADVHIYHEPNDMDSNDAKDELPNLTFGGMNVRNMYLF